GVEFAAKFRRGLRFQVERVEMRRAAGKVHMNNRIGLPGPNLAGLGEPQIVGERESRAPEHAQPQHIAPSDPIAEYARGHEGSLRGDQWFVTNSLVLSSAQSRSRIPFAGSPASRK